MCFVFVCQRNVTVVSSGHDGTPHCSTSTHGSHTRCSLELVSDREMTGEFCPNSGHERIKMQ